MIELADALKLVDENTKALGTFRTELQESAGFVLAEDVKSDINMPPFNKSAVDGFACRREDLFKELLLIETIPAGKSPQKKITSGTCTKIMTGAEVPDGADCVIMVENTREENNKVVFTGKETGNNIAYLAEDAQMGQVLISAPVVIGPQQIAIMASTGTTHPLVYKKPQVIVFATGSELVEPHQKPGPGKIRNSNGLQTLSQSLAAGFPTTYGGIIPDDPDITFNTLRKATSNYDVVILSGGVSMGEWDFIPKTMNELGYKILFDRIAVQPGKPTTLAVNDNKFILGLPGNPVSSLLQFALIGKRLLYNLSGISYHWNHYPVKLSVDYQRKRAERIAFVPVKLNKKNELETIPYNGSANIQAIAHATGYMQIDAGVSEIKKGKYATYRPL